MGRVADDRVGVRATAGHQHRSLAEDANATARIPIPSTPMRLLRWARFRATDRFALDGLSFVHGSDDAVLKNVKRRVKHLARDAENVVRYGPNAPRAAQLVYVDPRRVDLVYEGALWDEELPVGHPRRDGTGLKLDRGFTGCVLGGDWDLEVVALDACPKHQVCVRRFRDGRSWEEAGAYSLMRRIVASRPGADGCHTDADIVQRYRELDGIYEVVAAERRLRRQREMKVRGFRESGGVYVHVNRDGEALFAGGGFHRLAIAKLLELALIPAQLGVVHEQAVGMWRARFGPRVRTTTAG